MLAASDVGGHRELIVDRETGYLFPAGERGALADAIAVALGERSEWPRMIAAGRAFRRGSERTWRRSVRNYIGVYRAVLPDAPELQPVP